MGYNSTPPDFQFLPGVNNFVEVRHAAVSRLAVLPSGGGLVCVRRASRCRVACKMMFFLELSNLNGLACMYEEAHLAALLYNLRERPRHDVSLLIGEHARLCDYREVNVSLRKRGRRAQRRKFRSPPHQLVGVIDYGAVACGQQAFSIP